jgi:type II secretory pathway predicted ATPase ExeA
MIEHARSQDYRSTLENHFGFRESPFGVTPDPRFFYNHPHYAEGLAVLIHGLETKKGFMLVTGEVGTGKTILLRKLMRHFESRVQFVFVSNSHLTSYGLTELMVQSLGLATKEKNRLDMLQDLNNYLIGQLESGRTVALLIDEAQKLSDEALEGLCDLSNLETDEEKLLQIVLVGQPEVAAKLTKPSLRRIKQRIAIHHRVYTLQAPNEVDQYMRHRLRVAGYEGPEIFTKESVEAIWHYSSGTPRLINIICDNALALASVAGKKKVSPYLVMKAAGGLLLEQGSESPKAGVTEMGFFRNKWSAVRNAKRADGNGNEPLGQPMSTPPTPLTEVESVALPEEPQVAAAATSEEPQVSIQFFDRMTRAATEAMGPMAKCIVGDQISALGESREAFPQGKLAELVFRVSGEILNETLRNRFQETMFDEILTQKTM